MACEAGKRLAVPQGSAVQVRGKAQNRSVDIFEDGQVEVTHAARLARPATSENGRPLM